MDHLPTLAAAFIADEFLPTMAALAVAALREPMTWGVIGAGFVPEMLRRARAGKAGGQQMHSGAASARSRNEGMCKP